MKTRETQCVVSAVDYSTHWRQIDAMLAEIAMPLMPLLPKPRYAGPERRQNQHDRRFYAGQGGRRIFDRKS